MAKKKTLVTLLVDNSISFDLIENEKGNKAYEEEILSFDADNTDEYAKTGNFSGVRVYNFTPSEIPNFDKVCLDSKAWNYLLPIEEISLSDMTEKQVLSLLGIIGSELKSLYLNYSSFSRLQLDRIMAICPKLCKLELDDQNWERENRLPIELNKIGKQKFEQIICRKFAIESEANWSNLNIETINLDVCDTSTIIFPKKLKKLICIASNEDVFINGAESLSELEITINSEAAKTVDLKSLRSLCNLDLQIFFAFNSKVSLPSSIRTLKIGTSSSMKFSLGFLKELSSLDSLIINSADKGFKDFDVIRSLSKLKYFNFDENGIGNTPFKSDFKTEYLKGLKRLEQIRLRYVLNLTDFSFVKELESLKILEIDTSRVKTLKGLENGHITQLHFYDCHGISDLTPILKSKVVDFKFHISNLWATKVEMTVQTLNQLADSNIQNGEILMNKTKFAKKDLKTLEKVFNLEVEFESLNITRKK